MSRRIMGSGKLEISTANQEIVPKSPEGWTVPIAFKTFSFMNTQCCHIVLNGKSRPDGTENVIFLREYQGFATTEKDTVVHSFVIQESDIEYNWIGKY